ncbi:MAG: methyl-accepting chemotaxis protein [Desulfovibrio sp.]|jgi:methyl-accepting chemotaxis protein|nr:methyl-accepting chemotaxis protein [Desulfovibrio sp.]
MHGEAESISRITAEVVRTAMADVARAAESSEVVSFFAGDITDPERITVMNNYLKKLNDSYPGFGVMSVINSKGILVASADLELVPQKIDLSIRDYFQAAIRGNKAVSKPFYSTFSKISMLVTASPIKVNGEIVGVIYGALSLEGYFKNFIDPVAVGKEGFAYVVDSEGHVIVARNADWVFNDKLPAIATYKELARKGTPGWIETVGNDGNPVILYYLTEPTSKLTILIRAEVLDVFSGLQDILYKSVIVSVIASILCVIMVVLIIRPIVLALGRCVSFAEDIAHGNLRGQLNVSRSDEIGMLTKALRAIPETLNSIIEEYGTLETTVSNGQLDAQGDANKFSGEFSTLVNGTNAILRCFYTVIEMLPSPVALFDQNHKARYLNKVARELASGDFAGKNSRELFAAEDAGTPACAYQAAVTSGNAGSAETKIHPGGKVMDVSYTVIPMKNAQGERTSTLQLFTDLTKIKNTQRTIVEVASQAHDISNRVATASEELFAQIEQVNNGTEVQRERIATTATAMEEMNSTVLEVAKNAGAARIQADATRDKATEGSSLVHQVIQAIKQVNTVSRELEGNMKELGSQAEAIDSVINVISDIADQTNLLALNAAIEAARAGEAGRGFAVVADEVRKLAENTMKATLEVNSSIKAIQTSTTSNIHRVADAVSEANKATELAGTSGTALEEILSHATSNSALITSIATAAEEQSATSEEINAAIEEINKISDSTATSMKESYIAVQELSTMTQELKTTLDKLQN